MGPKLEETRSGKLRGSEGKISKKGGTFEVLNGEKTEKRRNMEQLCKEMDRGEAKINYNCRPFAMFKLVEE